MRPVALVLIMLVLHALSVLAIVDVLNPKPISGKKMTEEEFEEFVLRTRESSKPLPEPEKDIDENNAKKARQRLEQETQRIKDAEQKAAEALRRWEALSAAEKANVLKLAHERARKQEKNIVEDWKLSEELLKVEGKRLEKELDNSIKEQEELERKKIEEEITEFEQKRAEYRASMLASRTIEKAAAFWLTVFATSFIVSLIGFSV